MATAEYTDEIWKTIPFASDYAASSFGRIKRQKPTKYSSVEILSLSGAKGGYLKVKLFVDGAAIHTSAHKCVCAAFHGEKPSPLHVVAHWDGNRINNRPENLRWATSAENGQDQARHGKQKGIGHNNAKLTEELVREIRALRLQGHPVRAIASRFGLDIKHTYRLISRESWAHI